MLLELNFTLVLFAASFLVFIYLLNLTLYKPVGKVIKKRKALIEADYTKAKDFAQAANRLLEDYKKEIKSARLNAQHIIMEITNQAQAIRQEKVAVLTTNLIKEKEEALKQIKEEQKITMKQLEGQIKTLVNLITDKVIGSGEKKGKTLVSSH